MRPQLKNKTATLALATAFGMIAAPSFAQSCGATCDAMSDAIIAPASGDTPARVLPAEGFVLSLDGDAVLGDELVATKVAHVEVALAAADVDISYDSADPVPLLTLTKSGSGQILHFDAATNYPAFITRSEIRIIDRAAAGGPRVVAVQAVNANGAADIALPSGDLVAVLRVYDARGRFDETTPLILTGQEATADIADETRKIRVRGGTVTVQANHIGSGASLQTLGETFTPDSQGSVLISRILPSGDHAIDVNVIGGPKNLSYGRDIAVDASDWFYVVVADGTIWQRKDGETGDSFTENTARLQYFVKGETEGGLEITSSLDTGEGDIRDIFRRLDEKDPRALATRLGEDNAHVTYGDDSTSEDLTPTSGRVYLRVAKDESFAVWGDYQARINGSGYLSSNRNLYGAQAHLETNAATTAGEARATLDLHAAQPDELLGRDVFRGTDGSLYFLSRQDISAGTQTVTILRRDATTNRVIERVVLVEGVDYEINALQGVVILSAPLASAEDTGLIQSSGEGDTLISLEVQYEYTPIGIDGSGLTAAARGEAWLTDSLRFGATYTRDDSGSANQTASGVDLRYVIGENSYVQLDYARSEGPGYDNIFSTDGGLIFDTDAATAGNGEAVKIEGQVDLADLGGNMKGVIGGYAEKRSRGFSTADVQVDETTGDQRLVGAFIKYAPTDGLGFAAHIDQIDNTIGTDTAEIGAELSWPISAQTTLAFGAEYTGQTTDGATLARTDAAIKITYDLTEDTSLYAFAQSTIDNSGLDDNDRYGIGASHKFANGWSAEADISDGTNGIGGAARLSYDNGAGSTSYIGFERDPSRNFDTGGSARSNGQVVYGGRQKVTEKLAYFGENSYDILGARDEVRSSFGATYKASAQLTFGGTIAQGQVSDPVNGDLTRSAYSASMSYDNDALAAIARLEYRQDRDFDGSGRTDTDALVFAADVQYKIDESQRMLMSVTSAQTDATTASLLGGTYTEATLGYAYRPIDDTRMNILASYRYLYDTYGQSIDGVAGAGAVQESHILNLEGNYDLSKTWTLGGKLGYRSSLSAPSSDVVMTQNDAWLAITNARYHLVKNWDILLEARHFAALDADFNETGALIAAYRQVGQNVTVGAGYNFSTFSDDLGDLSYDDEGLFLNIIATF